jgi:hypothetical protein
MGTLCHGVPVFKSVVDDRPNAMNVVDTQGSPASIRPVPMASRKSRQSFSV